MIYDANGNKVRPMTRQDRIVLWMFAWIAAWWLLFLAFAAWGVEITVQVSDGKQGSSVYLPSLPQATSTHVVYVQDAITDGAFELWSAPIDGGVAIRLSNALAVGQSVKFAITPDGQRVVYQTDQTTRGIPDLYSVPTTGGASVKLSMDLSGIPGQVRDFLVSPTSQRAYYAADGATNNKIELWSVNVAGGPSTRLNASISTEHDVFAFAVSAQDRVVYRVGRSSVGQYELWSVPGDGRSSQARRISKYPMVTGGSANEFTITKDGARVVYIADAEDNGEFNLYAVTTAGGASTRLNVVAGGVVGFIDVPDAGGARVAYKQNIASVTSWWSVPVTGGTPIPVQPPIEPPVTSPDGRWTAHHVASVLSLTRGACTTQIDRPVVTTFLNRPAYSISPDSKWVVFVSGGDVWSSAISASLCEIFIDNFETDSLVRWQ